MQTLVNLLNHTIIAHRLWPQMTAQSVKIWVWPTQCWAECVLGGQLASGRVYERQPQVLVEADPTLHLLTDDWLGRNCCLSGYCTKSPQTHKYKYTNTNSKTQIQIHKCTSLMVPHCTCWLMIGCGGRNCIIKARYTFFNALSAFKKIIQCFAQVRDQVQCGQHRWLWLPSVCCLLSTEEGFQIGDTWKSAPPHIQHVCSVSENIRISKEWYLDLTRSSNVVHSDSPKEWCNKCECEATWVCRVPSWCPISTKPLRIGLAQPPHWDFIHTSTTCNIPQRYYHYTCSR